MGKLSRQQLPVVQPQRRSGVDDGFCSRFFCCRTCSIGVSRIFSLFSFKCILVLLLTLSLSVYAFFSVLPHHSKQSGFDAKESIKLSATVQAYFTLQKPVTELIPHISELEHDIFDEIALPSTKVAILSMHRAAISNWTDVVFGVLPSQPNVSNDPYLLTLLRSILVDLYLQGSNLTLTNATFGQPFSFNILKFQGGITLIPDKLSPPIGQIPEILFNFTLNNSIDEIKENFMALNKQLRLGLHLMPDENVYLQVTNKKGSTRDPPVVVDASITSELGFMLPQRLKQLAQIISGSSAKNLGLDNSVFGKVKEVILSSCLNHSLHPLPPSPFPSPSPSPSPSPETIWDSGPSLSPAHFQSDPPAPVNFHHLSPSSGSDTSAPSDASRAFAPNPECSSTHWHPGPNYPAPSVNHKSPNCGPTVSPSSSPTPHTNPAISDSSPTTSCRPPIKGPNSKTPIDPPSPAVSCGSIDGSNSVNLKMLVSPPGVLSSTSASSSSWLRQGFSYKIWWICLLELMMFSLLCSTFHLG